MQNTVRTTSQLMKLTLNKSPGHPIGELMGVWRSGQNSPSGEWSSVPAVPSSGLSTGQKVRAVN